MIPYSKINHPQITSLLFPEKKISPSPCPDNAEDMDFMVDSEIKIHCRYYSQDQNAPVLFYYPATGYSPVSFDRVAQNYLNKGINVFLASYRGCGKNSGSPSIDAMYKDSETLFDQAVDWLHHRAYRGPIFVMGQSLGSICAINTVFKKSDLVKGLIIESGVCGTKIYLQAMGVSLEQTDITEQEGFNTIEKIAKIKIPTLIFHGARDELVTIAEAEKIQASSGARTKQFIVIPGAKHHTVNEIGGDLYIQTIKNFTDTVCGVNTWRQKRKSHISDRQGKKI